MDDPFGPAPVAAGETPPDETQLVADLQEALRACLADLRLGLTEIRSQLEKGVGELRAGAEPRSLAVAVENLTGFFALLSRMNESFEESALPALDRLDGAVNRGVTDLEAPLSAGDPAALARCVESGLLAALEGWPAVAEELEGAIAGLTVEQLAARA